MCVCVCLWSMQAAPPVTCALGRSAPPAFHDPHDPPHHKGFDPRSAVNGRVLLRNGGTANKKPVGRLGPTSEMRSRVKKVQMVGGGGGGKWG